MIELSLSEHILEVNDPNRFFFVCCFSLSLHFPISFTFKMSTQKKNKNSSCGFFSPSRCHLHLSSTKRKQFFHISTEAIILIAATFFRLFSPESFALIFIAASIKTIKKRISTNFSLSHRSLTLFLFSPLFFIIISHKLLFNNGIY